jgi:hypothetical protein
MSNGKDLALMKFSIRKVHNNLANTVCQTSFPQPLQHAAHKAVPDIKSLISYGWEYTMKVKGVPIVQIV